MNEVRCLNDIYKELQSNSSVTYITTLNESIDTVINGGIPLGSITQLCGFASSGKTQLWFVLIKFQGIKTY